MGYVSFREGRLPECTASWEPKGTPPNANSPQEIAGLIKGLLTIGFPYFLGGGGFGGAPLDCHDCSLSLERLLYRFRVFRHFSLLVLF